MRMERSVCFERSFMAKFTFELFLLGWQWDLSFFIKFIEFLTFFNVLFGKVVFSYSDFIQNQLNMIFFLFCVENIIVFFLIFFFELADNFFKKSRINSI